MIVSQKWKIQNKLYQMKARKNYLERFIKTVEKEYKIMVRYKLLKRDKCETISSYIISLMLLFILSLDKLLGYYYMKYKAISIMKKAKKEILTLTKEIDLYEQYN